MDIVIRSSAITTSKSEIIEAKKQGLPCLMRAEMLNAIMQRFRHKISVAGTHGKTTTTAMIATILSEADIQTTYLSGSPLKSTGANANLGTSDYFVTESDESDGSLQNYLQIFPL